MGFLYVQPIPDRPAKALFDPRNPEPFRIGSEPEVGTAVPCVRRTIGRDQALGSSFSA